jgi:Protein kinase domain/P21-Rho-binding domain
MSLKDSRGRSLSANDVTVASDNINQSGGSPSSSRSNSKKRNRGSELGESPSSSSSGDEPQHQTASDGSINIGGSSGGGDAASAIMRRRAHTKTKSKSRMSRIFSFLGGGSAENGGGGSGSDDFQRPGDGGVLDCSTPINVSHEIHVDFDSESGFRGLPTEWEALLKSGGITKQEALDDSEAVLKVLEFQSQRLGGGQSSSSSSSSSASSSASTASSSSSSSSSSAPPLGKSGDSTGSDSDAVDPNMPRDKKYSLKDLVSRDDPHQIYGAEKKIGEGAAGEVFLATDSRDKRQVAIKKMALTAQNMKMLVTEIGIMKDSSHNNIVEYYDSYLVGDRLWCVMEYLGGGCLTEILEQFETLTMTESHIARVCRETLKALEYIHSLHRIHRDIKRYVGQRKRKRRRRRRRKERKNDSQAIY